MSSEGELRQQALCSMVSQTSQGDQQAYHEESDEELFPGKLLSTTGIPGDYMISIHVLHSIKEKIRANKFIDLVTLLPLDPVQEEEVPLQFYQVNQTAKVTQQHCTTKLDQGTAWNKGFCIFKKIYCIRCPKECLALLQYIYHFNGLSVHFPFEKAYSYDKHSCHAKAAYPNKLWNVADLHLHAVTLFSNNHLSFGAHQGADGGLGKGKRFTQSVSNTLP